MHRALRVARREYMAAVRTRGFIIGLVLAPVLMGGSALAMVLLGNRVDTTDMRIAVVDRSGLIGESLIAAAAERNAREVYRPGSGKKVRPAYLIELAEPREDDPLAQELALSDRVREGDLHAFVEIGPRVLHPGEVEEDARIIYYGENAVLDEPRDWIAGPINQRLRRLRLAEMGIDESSAPDLFSWIQVEGLGLVSADPATGEIKEAARSSEIQAIVLPIMLLMLMFLLIMMGAGTLLNAVVEEKSQRIAEVVLGSIRPFPFMVGKLLGGVAVSLTASAVYVIGGALAVTEMGFGGYVPYDILPWFIVYLITAVVMMGSVFAALGSACSDVKDAHSMQMPAMLPLMIPIFVMVPVLKDPQTTFATWLSFFPPFTPTLMLLRQSSPAGIPAWQPWAGLALVLAFTVFTIWAGGRIFRVGMLMQGKPPRLSDLLRWAVRG